MKYMVYKRREMFSPQEVRVIEATEFKVKDCNIIFKKGLKNVALFNIDEVDCVVPEEGGNTK